MKTIKLPIAGILKSIVRPNFILNFGFASSCQLSIEPYLRHDSYGFIFDFLGFYILFDKQYRKLLLLELGFAFINLNFNK